MWYKVFIIEIIGKRDLMVGLFNFNKQKSNTCARAMKLNQTNVFKMESEVQLTRFLDHGSFDSIMIKPND